MLYTFKSPVAGDLIMLQPDGDRVLDIIGKAGLTGIILPAQMPTAIAALESAAAAESGAAEGGDHDVVSLRQRVVPFIEMLKACHLAGKHIVWGV